MKLFILILTIFTLSPMALAKKRKAQPKTAFEQCIYDIKAASTSLTKAGKSLDGIFRSYDYKGFNHFSKLVYNGKKKYITKAENTLSSRDESLTTYGYSILQSVQNSLPDLRTKAGKCKKSCSALNRSRQHEKNLQIKCKQLNNVANGFLSFVKSPSQETITIATDAIISMKGTKRNDQIIASSRKTLEKMALQARVSKVSLADSITTSSTSVSTAN